MMDQMSRPTLITEADSNMLADIGTMAYSTDADILANQAANVSANLLAPRQSLHCNHSLDQGTRYNIAYLCESV